MWLDLKKNRIEIRVCCFNCVNYMVCLINNGGIENRILIEKESVRWAMCCFCITI